MLKRTFLATAVAFFAATSVTAQSSSSEAIIRIVDIGPGLCAVAMAPGGHGMVFDAGPPGATNCQEAVRELVPGRRLDLFVLSHSDKDHIGMVKAILGAQRPPNQAQRENLAAVIIHSGDPRGPTVDRMRLTLTEQERLGACVYDLRKNNQPRPPCRSLHTGGPRTLMPGDSFAIGAATATFIAGWGDGNDIRDPSERRLDNAARNNGLSVVIRFEYGGHSVLITGDSIGRTQDDPSSTCAYAERIMVSRAATVPIDSDVLVAGHHGADNSSSTCFIRAVSPKYVIFSAGHEYHHPRQAAVARFLANGVDPSNLFRTDLGDNEGGTEMTAGSGGCEDPTGDDDVEVRLPSNSASPITVAYRGASAACTP